MRHLLVLAPLAALAWAGTAVATPPSTSTVTRVPGPNQQVVFSLERDYRRCISPLCGGWWVTPLNHEGMRCRPNGAVEERCYVAEVDWDLLGLAQADLDEVMIDPHVLISGVVTGRDFGSFGMMAVLEPEHAWVKKVAVP